MSTATINGKHKKRARPATTPPVLPDGKRCTNCGALVPHRWGVEPIKTEILTRTCYKDLERLFCGHCESAWKASEDLSEWIDGFISSLPDMESDDVEQLSDLILIPEDRSTAGIVHRIRLLNDAATVCRQVFLALGARP